MPDYGRCDVVRQVTGNLVTAILPHQVTPVLPEQQLGCKVPDIAQYSPYVREFSQLGLEEGGKMGVNLYGDDPSKPPGQGPGQDSRARPDLYDYFIGARLCGVYDVPRLSPRP